MWSMKRGFYRVLGIRINNKLYERDIFYFLHRFQVGTSGVTALGLFGVLGLIFSWRYFDIMFVILLILLCAEMIYSKYRYPHGADVDYLFKKSFYKITMLGSFLLILIFVISIKSEFISVKELTYSEFKLLALFLLGSMATFLNSIFVLKTAFKTGS